MKQNLLAFVSLVMSTMVQERDDAGFWWGNGELGLSFGAFVAVLCFLLVVIVVGLLYLRFRN